MKPWSECVHDLRRAMYTYNMVMGRKRFYTHEYEAKVSEQLMLAAAEVAAWKDIE